MPKAGLQPDDRVRLIGERIMAALVRKGWTQERLELEARIGQGRLSHILRGKQTRVHAGTLKRLENALGLAPGALAAGAMAGASAEVEGARLPALEQLDGYAEAEFHVARLEPEIPFEVFVEARKTRWQSPPALVTVDFLRNYVRFLHEHMFGDTSVNRSNVSSNEQAGRTRVAAGSSKRRP